MKFKTISKRRYVKLSNEGFTFIEALLGLVAFCLVAAILPICIYFINNLDRSNARLQGIQWEVFSSQIKKEIRMSQQIEPQSTRLLLKKDSDSILYEQNGSNLRRRVNFSGNEILLQNINSVNFDPIRNGVIIHVKDVWSKEYSVTVRSYLNLGNP